MGEGVVLLDGSTGTVVAVVVTLGAEVRYNLTVQDLHTYAVGADQWVVHNCPIPGGGPGKDVIPNPRGRQDITVWRAVKAAELEDIERTGMYRTSPMNLESKYFSTTMDGAEDYGRKAFAQYPQEGSYTLTSGKFPRALLTPDMQVQVDQGIDTLVIPADNLPDIFDVRIRGPIRSQ